ncbi:MAG: sigma-54 interaction domain-containing protein [Gemmataceae bacterium]
MKWSEEQQVLCLDFEQWQSRYPGFLPPWVKGRVMALPLAHEQVPAFFLMVARLPNLFKADHEAQLQDLREPFVIAWIHACRLRELEILRAAAEADKQSLLAKLGRADVQDKVVGSEGGLRPVMRQVDQVASSDVPVLILGETGSGKEVVAREIHLRSRSAEGAFLRVNCGAIPPELIDSELFGHEKGSFTGASGLRTGWFERADGGTLFLDECGELPLAAQVRLLRILQDGTFQRVGGEKQLHVKVRVIAATHRDLRVMVDQGLFRQDLWYRLAVFPIHLPALRERPEDIPALANHFCFKAAKRLGIRPLQPSPADLQMLQEYAWPGNVRELAAVLERAAILGDGRTLEIATALGINHGPLDRRFPSEKNPSEGQQPIVSLHQAMIKHIESALTQTRGVIEGQRGAASLLKINPHTLRAKMRKLGIDWSRFR